MKTDTVNTESNFFEENWRHLNDGEIGCFIGADENIYLTTTTNDFGHLYPNADAKYPCKNSKETARLIVTAVNACKEINPDNPLNAASHLVELVEMYKKLQMELEHFINATPTGDKRVQLTGLNILALWKLNQITE